MAAAGACGPGGLVVVVVAVVAMTVRFLRRIVLLCCATEMSGSVEAADVFRPEILESPADCNAR